MGVTPSDTLEAWNTATTFAAAGQFDEMLAILRDIVSRDSGTARRCADLLMSYGFLSEARVCYLRAQNNSPNDLSATANLAALAHLVGEHGEARRLYGQLLKKLPDHPMVRRNALLTMEYDPEISDFERLAQAEEWGRWAMARVGGARDRPKLTPSGSRALRIGYASADFCQHTVGLFVKDVLKNHDFDRFQVFAYSAGNVQDWVTSEIQSVCNMNFVSALDDVALAKQIQADKIDILVDLSGHTAGSRLTTFAYRPAPVMVSWLGYFATTGLPIIDAVLLDDWHAPPGAEAQFCEQIIRLPRGKFCYQPAPWAPAQVSPPPVERNGFVSFGSFSNNAKFNENVFDIWSRILEMTPQSRLILKWRNFNDADLKQKITSSFVSRRIASDRIELRGPSFHADLLTEYNDIDIALDPFPFTGGLTSCEALWMGVPVVTYPQSRVVSRQTYSLQGQIGLTELSARDPDDYIRIAVELAKDTGRLANFRQGLREKMRNSPLMDVAAFTRQIEDTFVSLYQQLEDKFL